MKLNHAVILDIIFVASSLLTLCVHPVMRKRMRNNDKIGSISYFCRDRFTEQVHGKKIHHEPKNL